MRNLKLYLCTLFCIFAMHIGHTQSKNALLSKEKLYNYIEKQLLETQRVFNWKDAPDEVLYSALMHSDSILNIGYKPVEVEDLGSTIHLIDFKENKWISARDKVMDIIRSHNSQNYGRSNTAFSFPNGLDNPLPYFNARVMDMELISKLRNTEEVMFADVFTFSMTQLKFDLGFGCGNNAAVVVPADYTAITPMARQSWHHAEHNVACAWENSNAGEGKTIAVFDTGISDVNPKYNGQFAEGMSAGRTITKVACYPTSASSPNGWEDHCGHGTSMAGLAAAPRGFNDSPAGVAYRSDLVTFRVTGDVIIDCGPEKTGVIKAFNDVACGANTQVDIVSMSLGDVFYDGAVHMAIQKAANVGKMIFCAGGTSTTFTGFVGVIFPADQKETIAVTGVVEGSNFTTCAICHDGPEIDFVISMERGNGTNALTTAINDNSGNGFQEYEGGSSAATATMAGIAAVAWANNCDLDCGQMMNRLIKSTYGYNPNVKDDEHGWGRVDACAAADTTWRMPCEATLGNDVILEITKISFPAENDGPLGETEWVLTFNNETFYFDVAQAGVTRGYPGHCLNRDACDYEVPIRINLGQTNCNENTLMMEVSSHEDDSIFSNCTCDSGFFVPDDDDHCNGPAMFPITFGDGMLSVPGAENGDIIIEYDLYCTPTDGPSVFTIDQGEDITYCQNEVPTDLIFSGNGGTAEYTITYDINGGAAQTTNTTGGSANLTPSTATTGVFTYNITNIVDVNGCSLPLEESIVITISEPPVATLVDDAPACVTDDLTFTAGVGAGMYDFFIDSNNNGALDAGESLQNSASNVFMTNTLADGDIIGVVAINGTCSDLTLNTITLNPATVAPIISTDACGVTVTPDDAGDNLSLGTPDNATGGASAGNFDTGTGIYTAQPGDAAGTIDIVVVNSFGCAPITTTINTPFCAVACPATNEVDGDDAICSRALGAEISDWQTAVETDATNVAAVADMFTDPIEYSTALVPGDTPVPNGNIASGEHSGLDQCAAEDQLTYAYLPCYGPNGIQGDGDDIYTLVGTHTLTVNPLPQAPMILLADATCAYSYVAACGAETFDPAVVPTAVPGTDPAPFTVTVTLNGCDMAFEVDPPACPAVGCPTFTVISTADEICDGDLASEITDWQTAITTDATNVAAIADVNTGNAVEYSSMSVPTDVIAPDGILADGSHSGLDMCASEDQVTFAYLLCFGTNGIPGDADDQYLLLGTHTLTVNPLPQVPAIVMANTACAYAYTPVCGAETFSPATIPTAVPGTDPGLLTVTVTLNGCSMDFDIDVPACPAIMCPTIMAVDSTDMICDLALTNEIADWQTGVETNATNSLAIADINTDLAVVYSTDSATPNGMIADGVYAGDGCTPLVQTTYAFLLCFGDDGIQGTVDDNFLSLGMHTLTINPLPQAPTIMMVDNVCNYAYVPVCGGEIINPALSSSPPETDPAPFMVTVSLNGCSMDFMVDPPECPAIPCLSDNGDLSIKAIPASARQKRAVNRVIIDNNKQKNQKDTTPDRGTEN